MTRPAARTSTGQTPDRIDLTGEEEAGAVLDELELHRLRRELDRSAVLFDDPGAYRAGIADALDAVARELRHR